MHKQWRWEDNHTMFGTLELDDEHTWRTALDYYFHLHTLSDSHIGRILDALDETGHADDTVVIFTSDHGEQAGSHGLRGKGPFAYEEIMHVPLYVRAPGLATPGSSTDRPHVECRHTVTRLVARRSRRHVLAVRRRSPRHCSRARPRRCRDHVLFAEAQGWHLSCVGLRYALRGDFDGRYKYVRYFGIGGGVDNMGQTIDWQHGMRFGPDAAFVDHEHELYDHTEDPHELENLGVDRARWAEVRDHFDHLLELEAAAFTHTRPSGAGGGSTHAEGMFEKSAWFGTDTP